jgi:peptidoglycan/xylan/chitin deacetylase (PgdA/CDA1 family)
LPLLERVGKRRALAVLVYHRIASRDGHAYDKDVVEATPQQFDDQMRMLKKRHTVVAPDEIADIVAKPEKLRGFAVAITFDDGYRDNYTNAFPILKDHGIRAAFFLPTHYIGSRNLPFWDQVANTIRRTKRKTIELTYPSPVRVELSDGIDAAIRKVLRAYTRAENADVVRFLRAVEEACGLALPAEADDRQFMTWDEAAEMSRAGMAMGSHTHSHRILALLSRDEQLEDIKRSRDILVEKGVSTDFFAYPVGKKTAFSDTTIAVAKEAGYRFAFTNYGGINEPGRIDPMDIRRLGMDFDEDASQLRVRLALTRMTRRQAW